MDPQENLKKVGAEQATMVGGARTKPANAAPQQKEAAPEYAFLHFLYLIECALFSTTMRELLIKSS